MTRKAETSKLANKQNPPPKKKINKNSNNKSFYAFPGFEHNNHNRNNNWKIRTSKLCKQRKSLLCSVLLLLSPLLAEEEDGCYVTDCSANVSDGNDV